MGLRKAWKWIASLVARFVASRKDMTGSFASFG